MERFDIGILEGDHINPMHLVIYQRTSTWWTHCVTFKNDKGDIWDPREGGIGNNNISKYAGRHLEILRYKHPTNQEILEKWVEKTVAKAKGYDIKAIFGFLTGIPMQDDNNWYCSEFAYWLFQDNNYSLTREDMILMYPSHLYFCNEFVLVDSYTI